MFFQKLDMEMDMQLDMEMDMHLDMEMYMELEIPEIGPLATAWKPSL